MSELHDKARARLDRARGLGSGPTRKEWTDTLAALLAENEQLKQTMAFVNSTLIATEEQALNAETQLRELCGAAYQALGAACGPVEMLDNLSAAASGVPMPHDPMAGLPWTPQADRLPCLHCDGAGEIETENNGPIVPCPICRPAVKHSDQFAEKVGSPIQATQLEAVGRVYHPTPNMAAKVIWRSGDSVPPHDTKLYTAPPAPPGLYDGNIRDLLRHVMDAVGRGDQKQAMLAVNQVLALLLPATEVNRG